MDVLHGKLSLGTNITNNRMFGNEIFDERRSHKIATETWRLTKKIYWIGTWKRKILRKLFGSVLENGMWRIRTNHELTTMFTRSNILMRDE